ncbi:MAG: glycerate kinase [Deltaproteobacteria bacterium]|nr:glycerate kinase [Deltaproteobacteria bacterium]
MRRDALAIFHAGVRAVDPAEAITRHLRLDRERLQVDEASYDLSTFAGVYVIGAGKAAARMAQAVEEWLGGRLTAGIVNVKYGHATPLRIVGVHEGGHPVPDEAGVRGTEAIIALLRRTGQKDLVLCLLSGGGSALLPCPAEGITLADKQLTTQALMACGARIQEVNAVRKHISRIKGGRLARLASPSTLVSLILSDVVGDDLGSIASGPTAPDTSTFADCLGILKRYGVTDKVPCAVRAYLEQGAGGAKEETPKASDPAFARTQNVIIGSNIQSVRAAKEKADALGYHSLILSSFVEGEAREVAKVHAAIAREVRRTGHPVAAPACVISGGETTVTIRGRGTGGRNQEFALAAAVALDGLAGVVVLSGGTDGTDGPTDAAGALADGQSVSRALAMGLAAEEHLGENDSYRFFHQLGDLLITGPTFTNVMDLRLVLVG